MAILIIISIAGSAYFYNSLPQIVPIHWNALGVADGFGPKEFNLFFIPAIEILLSLLFIVIPRIEPKKKNLNSFALYYYTFSVLLIAFFTYIHYLILISSTGISVNITLLIGPALGVVIFYIGVMMKHAKQNYLVGIRTPWTLASEKVWNKTHQKGSILFKISGLIAFLGLFLPSYAIWLVIVPILVSAFWTIIYSYVEYSHEK